MKYERKDEKVKEKLSMKRRLLEGKWEIRNWKEAEEVKEKRNGKEAEEVKEIRNGKEAKKVKEKINGKEDEEVKAEEVKEI